MKRPGVDGGFILCFFLNLVLNSFWAIPAVVLFVAHFVAGIPIWPAWVALFLWIAVVFGITAFMSWAATGADMNSAGTGTRGSATIRYASQNHTMTRGENERGSGFPAAGSHSDGRESRTRR